MSEVMTEAASGVRPQRGDTLPVRNDSRLGAMFWIGTYTTLLSIVTLTIFRFWGRTQFRRRLWSETRIGGEPLEYSGRGMELFVGFVIATLFIMTPVLAGLVGAQLLLPPAAAVAVVLLIYAFLFVISGVAIFMARRYHLSRTRYRGVRFAQTGSPMNYAWAYIGYSLLSGITLGWYGPAARLRLSKMMWSGAYYGNQPFRFEDTPDAAQEPVYRSFAVAWAGSLLAFLGWGYFFERFVGSGAFDPAAPDPLVIVKVWVALIPLLLVIGAAFAWHEAVMVRRIVKSLSVSDLRFTSRLKTMDILELSITNALLVFLTLGFGFMAAQMRMWKRIANSMSISGAIDFAAIRQSEHDAPRQGEGLADGLDLVSNF
jgi:uncharacterized membrane protein YjgN (DUF898 family)